MKRKIYKGGVDNYPLWWYGQSNRLQNFGDKSNFLIPHGAVFQGNGYYFNGANGDYLEDIYGRHLLAESTNGLWSYLYLTDSAVPPCGSAVGTGNKLYLPSGQAPRITGKIALYPEYCPNLVTFYCRNNNISALDVSRMASLVTLNCYTNSIPALDVSGAIKLGTLTCASNDLLILDVSNLLHLVSFSCHDNLLSALDLSHNPLVKNLLLENNLFNSTMVDTILVVVNSFGTSSGTLDISGNTAPSQTGIDAKNDMVNNRGWTVTTD